MKIANLVFQTFLSLIIAGFLIYTITAYDSAFEADQMCHSILTSYNNQSENYGCDHDTETHQWILYNIQGGDSPAKIIKKFRYKFL